MASNVVNLDVEYEKEHGDQEPIDYVTVQAFGEEFRVSKKQNVMNLLFATDGDEKDQSAAIVRAFIGAVHADDQKRLKKAIGSQQHFTGEDLMWWLERLLQIAAEDNPSPSRGGSRGSGTSSKRTTARKRSAANSSSRALTRAK